MSRILTQSTTRNLVFLAVSSTDHVTGVPALTLTVTISKNGGAFAAPGAATPTSLGSGWYNLALTTTDTNTIGDLAIHITGTGVDPTDFLCQVGADVNVNTWGGASLGGLYIGAKLFANTALDDEGEVWPRQFKTSESTANRRRVYFYMLQNAASGNLSVYFTRQSVGNGLYASAAALCNGSATAQISKNGGVPANVAGTFTEIDSLIAPGLIQYEFTATELDTPGYVTLFLGGSSGNPRPRAINVNVVAEDVFDGVRLGMSALPNAAANAVGGLAARVLSAGTASAGAATSITLAGAVATANYYNGAIVSIVAGTGVGQSKRITAYSAARVATVDSAWATNPDATSVFIVESDSGWLADASITAAKFAASAIDSTVLAANAIGASQLATGAITNAKFAASAIDSTVLAANAIGASQIAAAAFTSAKFDNTVNVGLSRNGTAQAGGASTITLDAGAVATDDYYTGQLIRIVSGTGLNQARGISLYVGSTKVATVNRAWKVNPDVTSVFQILPVDEFLQLSDLGAVWDVARASHTTAGTFGQGVASVQGNVTGSVASVTGAVGSVTGAVGSVTGNVGGNVVGSVASVTGNVGGNVVGSVASVTGNVGGNVTGSVGSVASGGITAASLASATITAAKFGTDAIDSNAVAATAVTKIQAGLATSSSISTLSTAVAGVQTDTDDIQTRLPSALVGGKMDSHVNDVSAGAITAIQSGLATSASIALLQAKSNDIAGLLNENSVLDKAVFVGSNMTSARIRVFSSQTLALAATLGAADNADGEIFRYLVVATYTGSNLTSYTLTKDL